MPSLKTITIFLASSAELKEERDNFKLFIAGLNDKLISQHIYLKVVQWEKFLDAISETRLQDEYNKALVASDIALCLFFTKVGKFTKEEFNTAYAAFKATGKPKIWTYFKDAALNTGSITKEINTLLRFKKKLSQLGHFFTSYKDTRDLQTQFRDQLEHVIPELILPVSRKERKAAVTINTPALPLPPAIVEAKPVLTALQKDIDIIDALLEEPTPENIRTAINTLAGLTKNTGTYNYITPLRAEMIQFKSDKLAGFNMDGRLNKIIVSFQEIYKEFKKSTH